CALAREDVEAHRSVLDELLLRRLVAAVAVAPEAGVMRLVVVLGPERIDELLVARPLVGQVVEACGGRLRRHAPGVGLLLAGRRRAVVDPEPGDEEGQGEPLPDEGREDYRERQEDDQIPAG